MTDRTGNAVVLSRPDLVDLKALLRDQGFAVAPNFIDEPLRQILADEATSLIDRYTREGYRSDDYWCYDIEGQTIPMLYRVHNLERQGMPRISALFADGPLHRLAAAVLGHAAKSNVCAMIVKTPRVAGVPWHRDRTNVPPTSAINLSLFLDQASTANGCVEAVPGSHLLPDDADIDKIRNDGPCVQVLAEPGDVLIHDVRLVHGSGDNTSRSIRRSICIEFSITDANVPGA